MGVRVGAAAPLLGMLMGPIRPTDDDESPFGYGERRRYPPPELEIGVIAAFKIAAIIFAPLSVIAGLFGLYLQGFRADLRLDMQKVVTEALEKHVEIERTSYATIVSVDQLHREIERLRISHEDMGRRIRANEDLLQRLAQKNGLR